MTHEPSDPAPSAPDPALARDLGRLLDELVDQTAGEAIDQGDDPELTPPVSRVLRALAGAPGPRTVEQVARRGPRSPRPGAPSWSRSVAVNRGASRSPPRAGVR